MLLWLAALLGASGVIAGAIGSHVVESGSSAFQIGVRYQLIHAIVIFIIALVPERVNPWSAYIFSTGIVLFSGSLYGIAWGGPAWLGPLTPLGGVVLVSGWLLLPWKQKV
ncbi:MAG: DUF423 domain-containing protein [Pseudomonadota bacterium]|nr:DUF423 domain-containing protein [Pseudomonadota bacterium]